MKKRNFSFVAAWFVLNAAHAFAGNTDQGVLFRSYHSDYRNTPKLEEFKAASQKGNLALETAAREFLKEHATKYGITPKQNDLSLTTVKESLLGQHFHFTQTIDGIAVEGGEVIVSVSKDTNEVYRAYNNYLPREKQSDSKAKKAILNADKAFDIAWQDLKVHGKLQDAPKADLVYRVTEKGEFKLVYLTFLHTEAPFGAWQHEIDAVTGKVLSRVDTAIERKPSRHKADPSLYNGPISDRAASFAAFARSEKGKAKSMSFAPANGKGLVFDPDPRTTLNNNDLVDNTPAASFDAAYFERDLLDLSFDGTTYKLEGPWVKITNFESPATPPSTSTTGIWTAKRGDNAFNDAMTYYHIDKNQRYMQSLGFTGARAIQGGPIEVDSDGVSGDDNSHYIPGSNKMAFGHGCVDDNEDSDVILHEYGHAINKSINTNWNGGDTGAMGEGFGDYWAGSYSVSTEAGKAFKPFEVFSWDGHGPGDACWPGRVMNATELMYNPTSTYGAHQRIGGTRQSDELWSTPLFQALMALMEQGVPRDEVDQIILEAQFGLGAGIKMRDLAQATIAAAKRLQPGKAHAGVFIQKFAAQQIIDVPQAILALDSVSFGGTGNNNAADPGEALTLTVRVKNRGTLAAQSIQAVLTSETAGVTVTDGQSTFNDIDLGDVVQNADELAFSIGDSVACGSKVKLSLTLTYTGGNLPSMVIPIEFNLGVAKGMSGSVSDTVVIPDNKPEGITSTITIDADGLVTDNLTVDLNIQHTYIGDLLVVLTAPNGSKVNLHARSGGSTANLSGRYPTTLTPAESLSALVGKPMGGEWKLTVSDTANTDIGKLLGWGLNDVVGYECEQ